MNGRNNLISLGSVWLRRVIRRIRRRRPINNTLSIPCSKCVNGDVGGQTDCLFFFYFLLSLASKSDGATAETCWATGCAADRAESRLTAVERCGRDPFGSLRERSLGHVVNQITAAQRVISRNGQAGRGQRSCAPPQKKHNRWSLQAQFSW